MQVESQLMVTSEVYVMGCPTKMEKGPWAAYEKFLQTILGLLKTLPVMHVEDITSLVEWQLS